MKPSLDRIPGVGEFRDGVFHLTFEVSAKTDYYPRADRHYVTSKPQKKNADYKYHRNRVRLAVQQEANRRKAVVHVYANMRRKEPLLVETIHPNDGDS